jgi:hypothetical protein
VSSNDSRLRKGQRHVLAHEKQEARLARRRRKRRSANGLAEQLDRLAETAPASSETQAPQS